MTTTTLDAKGYGNVTASQVYDYAPSSPSLSRTTATTYLHDSNTAYDTAFIRNRVLTNTLTPAASVKRSPGPATFLTKPMHCLVVARCTEQIDTVSANLNFSITLLTAMGRGGWSVPFGLSYNSQNWRLEGSASWKMGADVGYGFGWRLMAGSLKPYYTGSWTLHHFIFTDATGAEYRLDQQDPVHTSVWSSKQSLYVWYDYATNLLHFKDGSYWYMGSTSAGVEQDAGTMYPTLMEDTNGNQVLVTYLPGAGPYSPSGSGWNPANTSARINQIFDSRARFVISLALSYSFTYSSSGDTINHITGITNTFGTRRITPSPSRPTRRSTRRSLPVRRAAPPVTIAVPWDSSPPSHAPASTRPRVSPTTLMASANSPKSSSLMAATFAGRTGTSPTREGERCAKCRRDIFSRTRLPQRLPIRSHTMMRETLRVSCTPSPSSRIRPALPRWP